MTSQESIIVFVDLPGGELNETGRGLLSYGARLSGTLGLPWIAVVPAAPGAESLAGFGSFGTPAVTVLDQGELLLDTPGALGEALAQLAAEKGGKVLLFPHDDLGSALAPVAAARLDAAVMSEVSSVRRGDGPVELSRPALGLRLAETRYWDRERPLVLTVPVRALSQVLMPTVKATSPALSSWHWSGTAPSPRVVERIPPDPQTVDLTEAEIIFSAGKGCDRETFEQLQELSRLLNVSCGVTRPVYDLGWTGFERMVGQTGRTVTPRLYLALGISGSMHHVGGIKDSRRIVALNNDPKAPIFPNSDEGFVVDLKEILPQLVQRAKSAVGGAS